MINEISKTPIFQNKPGKDENLREKPVSGEKPADPAVPEARDIVDVSGLSPRAGERAEKPPIPVNDQKSEVASDDNRGENKALNRAEENKTGDIPSKSMESQAEADTDKAIEAVKSNFVRSDTVASAYGQEESEIGKALNKVV